VDVAMPDNSIKPLKDVEILCGQFPKEPIAQIQFSDDAIDFLNDISTLIRNKISLNEFTDLKTFGFWCRSANLKKIKSTYMNRGKAVGRGIALHITPSNVAMNFAYSLAFGLLSGNINIVRIPSKKFDQVDALLKIIITLLKSNNHINVSRFICIIRYERSHQISKTLSAFADTRLIWGGDDTIEQFKKYQTKPKCLDLTFSNR
jgi:hypothetical protein